MKDDSGDRFFGASSHTYLSVGPLSLCVDGAVALCVLAGGLRL